MTGRAVGPTNARSFVAIAGLLVMSAGCGGSRRSGGGDAGDAAAAVDAPADADAASDADAAADTDATASNPDGADADPTADLPPLVPYPRSYQARPGRFALTSAARIVAASPELAPLANVVASDLRALAGLDLAVASGPPSDGDIVLALDPTLDGEAYVIDVDRVAAVSGRDYPAVAFATVTLLQAAGAAPAPVSLPRFVVHDNPDFGLRGLMLDLARNFHPLAVLKSAVVLCRHYKVRFLHLHLTDDQAFTFPSTAYPAVTTPGASYTLAEMHDLESFARDRGVEILPEVDMPGHSSALAHAAPDVFDCDPPLGMICPARAGVDAALDTLIGEVMDAFPSSRYFHLGGDEVNFAAYDQSAPCQAFMAQNGIANGQALYESFLARAIALVKARGRQPIVWEGFAATASVPVPRDTKVMVYESLYAPAPDLLAQGFQVINTSWQPLYVVNDRSWTPEYIYGWDVHRWEHFITNSKAWPNGIMIDPTPDLLGSELCAWEQAAAIELPTTRQRVAAMSERVYNESAGRSYADFAARLAVTDDELSRLLQ